MASTRMRNRHIIQPDKLYIMKGNIDYTQEIAYQAISNGILEDIWQRHERVIRMDMVRWINESSSCYEE